MKRIFAILVLSATALHAYAQGSLRDALEQIREDFGIEYVYDAGLDLDVPAGGVPAEGMRLGKSLNTVLRGTGITWTGKRRTVILKKARQSLELPDTVQNHWIEAARIQSARSAGFEAVRPGSHLISKADILETPYLLGEADLFRTLQMQPGVTAKADGLAGSHVRGGAADENLILLDGVPMYATDHLQGLYSVVPSGDVGSVSFYKGSFPAKYGGGASSILDIRTLEGDFNEHHRSIGIGLVSDRLHFDGPLARGRTSYTLSGRFMHSFFVAPVMYALRRDSAPFFFYDLNARVSHIASQSDKLSASFFHSDDRNLGGDYYYEYSSDVRKESSKSVSIGRGGTLGSLRWQHMFSGKFSSVLTLSVSGGRSRYKSDMEVTEADNIGVVSFEHYSGLTDYRLSADFEYKPFQSHDIEFGASSVLHDFVPGGSRSVDGGYSSSRFWNERVRVGEYAVYAEDSFSVGKHIGVNAGGRLVLYRTGSRSYFLAEPRAAVRLKLLPQLSLKTAYSRISQGVHVLEGASLVLPNLAWAPVTSKLAPLSSDIISAGAAFSSDGWAFSLEGFAKYQQNVLQQINSIMSMSAYDRWDEGIASGIGRTCGLELYAARTAGMLTGRAAYTLSRSMYMFPDGSINNGRWFPASQDNRHVVNVNLSYRLSENIGINVCWVFSSGGWTTVPDRHGWVYDGWDRLYAPSRNNYRLPANHRLDVSANIRRPRKRGEAAWNFGIYNVYAHRNPMFVHVGTDEAGRIMVETESPLIFFPSVSYTRTL